MVIEPSDVQAQCFCQNLSLNSEEALSSQENNPRDRGKSTEEEMNNASQTVCEV